MVNRIREVVPNAKLVYNNSPSFNWTLNFRQQVFDAMTEAGQDVSAYDRANLMSAEYDESELAAQADEKDPYLPGGRCSRSRYLPPPDHAADLPHCSAVY